jgi:hypothetical protein
MPFLTTTWFYLYKLGPICTPADDPVFLKIGE